MICRKTMQQCSTPSMCAPFGGCGESQSDIMERMATWVGLFVATGIELGIPKQAMLNALTPKKLAKIYDVMRDADNSGARNGD